MAMAIRKATPTSQEPSSQTGFGTKRPRLLSSEPKGSLKLSRGPGRIASTPRYQKKMTSSGGMLRKVSTYTWQNLRISQLRDSRPMPTTNPMMVAVTMPAAATSSVLRRPTISASSCVESDEYWMRLWPTSKPAR
jgi:hypothetical protein